MNKHQDSLAQAYRYCQLQVKSHYENFPVASLLLPRHLRNPIAAIYTFARRADDIADEGDASSGHRIDELNRLAQALQQLDTSANLADPMLIALNDTIHRYQLPIELFHDLLSAFSQDVTTTRYQTFDDVLDYCRRSANPIGRLLLYLTNQANTENLQHSDCICSALQIINFLQDMHQDMEENGRIYMPLQDLHRFQVNELHFRDAKCDVAMQRLFKYEVERAKSLLLQGASLGLRVGGRFGMQLRMMIGGGLLVCQHLENLNNCFDRPRLRRRDWFRLVKYAIMTSNFEKAIKPASISTYESQYR